MFAFLEDFRYTRWVKRLNRTAQVLLSLTLVGGLNYVAARHFTRWDLTPTRRYSLSAETLAYLDQSVRENMKGAPDKPLELILVSQSQMSEDDRLRRDQIQTLLKEYEDAGKSLPGGSIPLTIKEVDPDRQLDQAAQLQKYSPLIALPMVIVRYGDDRVRALNSTDLYHVEKDASGKGLDVKDFCGENAITSAILDVVQTKADKIYFTFGHGELAADTSTFGLSDFADALKQCNYKLGSINLSGLDDIPADATVVVIVLPYASRSAFSPVEQEKLRRYLNQRNGRVLLFLSANTERDQSYGLENLLREWGLRSLNLRVIETDPSHLVTLGFTVFNPVEDVKRKHLVTQQLARTAQPVLMGSLRPVEVDPDASEDAQHQVHELLATTKASIVIPPDVSGSNVVPIAKGVQVVAAISEKRASDAVDLPGGELMVYGDTDIITNNLFGQAANRQLMLDSVNYLAKHEHMLGIRPLAPKESTLDIKTAQLEGLGWRLAILPALMALFGLVVCWLRYRS